MRLIWYHILITFTTRSRRTWPRAATSWKAGCGGGCFVGGVGRWRYMERGGALIDPPTQSNPLHSTPSIASHHIPSHQRLPTLDIGLRQRLGVRPRDHQLQQRRAAVAAALPLQQQAVAVAGRVWCPDGFDTGVSARVSQPASQSAGQSGHALDRFCPHRFAHTPYSHPSLRS